MVVTATVGVAASLVMVVAVVVMLHADASSAPLRRVCANFPLKQGEDAGKASIHVAGGQSAVGGTEVDAVAEGDLSRRGFFAFVNVEQDGAFHEGLTVDDLLDAGSGDVSSDQNGDVAKGGGEAGEGFDGRAGLGQGFKQAADVDFEEDDGPVQLEGFRNEGMNFGPARRRRRR